MKDRQSGETPETRTSRLIREALNVLEPDLEFTTEMAEDFPEHKLPTLDYQLWITEVVEPSDPNPGTPVTPNQDGTPSFPDPVPLTSTYWEDRGEIHHLGAVPSTAVPPKGSHEPAGTQETSKKQAIRYMYYEKEVTSKFCTLEVSAMSWNMKRAILSQETIRRLLNTSEEADNKIKDSILCNMSKRLWRSGYSSKQIREIITSGLRGYKRKWGQGQTRHRRGHSNEEARSIRKLVGKQTWFKVDFKTKGNGN